MALKRLLKKFVEEHTPLEAVPPYVILDSDKFQASHRQIKKPPMQRRESLVIFTIPTFVC